MNPVESTEKNILTTESLDIELAQNLNAQEIHALSYYEDATPLDWIDWKWQLRNRISTKAQLKKYINLTKDEEEGIDECGKKLSMSITPYFASLMDKDNPKCPIRMQCVPRKYELETSPEEMSDPCGEDQHSPVHGLVHRYPDRVLFLASEMCAMYCRYCTRSRMVGDGKHSLSMDTYNEAFDYIRLNKNIRDVLVSGGDPLMLGNTMLENIIKKLKAITHVEFVRIGTRIPVTLPQRIDNDLIKMLKKYSPIYFSLHFSHYKEITKRVKDACNLLADSGIPLGSQTVLLKEINDNAEVMKKLMHELLKIRVRPYYIYQCDPILGSKHFRTTVQKGIDIIEKLRGFTSGYAVPTYVIDCPGGGGKIPVGPDYILKKENGTYTMRNFASQKYTYQDPK